MVRTRRRNASSNETYVAASFFIASVALIGGFVLYFQQAARSLDPDTLCPSEPLPARIAILVDASDPLTQDQQERLSDKLDAIIDDMHKHEWLGIYVLDEQLNNNPLPVFAKCHPGGAATANELYENPQMIEQALQRNFTQPLVKLLEQIAAVQDEQPTSSLLEMILGVSIATGWQSGTKGKFVIVSDMLHNTPEYSHYRGVPNFNDFSELEYSKQFLGHNLANVEILILFVRRPRDKQHHTRPYITFWEDYFAAVGAQRVQVQAL